MNKKTTKRATKKVVKNRKRVVGGRIGDLKRKNKAVKVTINKNVKKIKTNTTTLEELSRKVSKISVAVKSHSEKIGRLQKDKMNSCGFWGYVFWTFRECLILVPALLFWVIVTAEVLIHFT